MESKVLKNWWMPLLKGIILIVLSILVFMHPDGALLGLALYIGIGFLIAGVVLIIAAISFRNETKGWGWRLTEGLVDIFFGFILIYNPGLTAVVMAFMMGFWFLFFGITSLSEAFALKDEGVSNWWLGMIWGVLAIFFGFWIMFKPFAGAVAIVTLMGIFFLVAGLFNLAISFGLKGIKNDLEA